MQGIVNMKMKERRLTTITADISQAPVKATDLVEKLRMLYKVSMVSFIH